jgi:SAM-dependent methyltransferase
MLQELANHANNLPTCRLCKQSGLQELHVHPKGPILYYCPGCSMLMKSPSDLPDPEAEKARYLYHQNNPENEGYVSFLKSFTQRILPFVPKNCCGLDYGCGPHPVLSGILKAEGFSMQFYDPFFFPDLPVDTYDLITCTETAEHFHHPLTSIQEMTDLLRIGGVMAIMTEFYPPFDHLHDWYYLRDTTHVSFYNIQTMAFIARKFQLQLLYTDSVRTVVFRKLNGMQQ